MHQKIAIFYHYWYFKDIGSKYEPNLCNNSHGLMEKSVTFNDVYYC